MVGVEAIVAVAAGLLATTMAPCLMQVVVFYFLAISGLTMSDIEEGSVSQAELRSYKRKLVLLTAAFGAGILIVFTGFGFLVGYLGTEMRNVPLFTGDALLAQRIAGVGFILIGLWMANVTRTPIVCRIPFPSLRRNPQDLGYLGMFAIGFTFMFGCASCFAGAIIGALIVFIGATQAPLEAAAVMFFFGLGVVIPLMVASVILTEVMSLVQNLKVWSRRFGRAAAIIMILFGIVSLFGHFHTVTDWIWYRFYYPEGSPGTIVYYLLSLIGL